jgi:hypothetical protein
VTTATKGKASGQDDTAEVSAGKGCAPSKMLPDAVDAASSEAVKIAQRRALLELLSTPGVLDLDDPDVMAGAWR